ncbi:hypothetical protein [Planotetraspora mira]|uniref:Uncharacterized protein n=1 Tax=Planotetraspora mira TaxID=58121 RepID=A0A8J3XBF2_9ACTN|nr:hypothetical protein [Planotetraspora mira]GII34970.1 hypothetical protein Pmi06nite_84120 [Planotetraspora mira]
MTWNEFTQLAETTLRMRRGLFGDPTETIAITGARGNALTVQLAEFAGLPPDQRRVRIGELAAGTSRRAAAVDGSDDDEVADNFPLFEDDADDGPGTDVPRAGTRARGDLVAPVRRTTRAGSWSTACRRSAEASRRAAAGVVALRNFLEEFLAAVEAFADDGSIIDL